MSDVRMMHFAAAENERTLCGLSTAQQRTDDTNMVTCGNCRKLLKSKEKLNDGSKDSKATEATT